MIVLGGKGHVLLFPPCVLHGFVHPGESLRQLRRTQEQEQTTVGDRVRVQTMRGLLRERPRHAPPRSTVCARRPGSAPSCPPARTARRRSPSYAARPNPAFQAVLSPGFSPRARAVSTRTRGSRATRHVAARPAPKPAPWSMQRVLLTLYVGEITPRYRCCQALLKSSLSATTGGQRSL